MGHPVCLFLDRKQRSDESLKCLTKNKKNIAKIFGVNHCIVTNIIQQFQQECENIKTASQMDKPKNKFKARSPRIGKFSKSNPLHTVSENQ